LIRDFTLALVILGMALVSHGYAETKGTPPRAEASAREGTPARVEASARAGASARIFHQTNYWIDNTRPEPWTPDEADHRGILIQVYYVARAPEPAPAPASQPSPLVLFSTGRNEGPKTYADLAEALAKDGYVVAIVDHLEERSGQRLPDGTAVPNLLPRVEPDRKSPSFEAQSAAFSRTWVELRAADLTSARVHLQALAAEGGNDLSGLLNAQAAAVGHSIGGLAAAKACEKDPAFAACANLDGLSYSLPMHVGGDTMVATQPFLFLGKPIPRLSDATLEHEHMTRAQDDEIVARFARRFDALMQSAKGGSYRVLLKDADHMDFAGSGNGAVAKEVRAYLMAFLDKTVRGTRDTLLDVATSDPGVTVTRYPPRQ
jgi:hypothetical protein